MREENAESAVQEANGRLTVEFLPPVGRRMKGTVIAQFAGDTYSDRVDIVSRGAKLGFVEAVCRRWPALAEAEHRGQLTRQLERLSESEVVRLRQSETENAAKDALPDRAELLAKMPQSARAQAQDMLEDPLLMKRVIDDIGLLGVAGERALSATLYLVGVSRLLPRPLAAIVQGPSSSGKSYVIAKTATLFPPEAVVQATQITPQALYHMPPGSLAHRFVVAGERSRLENDEQAEATRALREILSEGRLAKLMPVKFGEDMQTVLIEQEGPIAFVESTTLGRIFSEDANRCLLLTTDERRQQTRQIIDKLAASYTGMRAEARTEDAIARHHALQRMLEPRPVVVPFAERLGELVRDERVEIRRAFPQLISTIQASALLHQRQRTLDSNGRLVAINDDYELARYLLSKPLDRLLGGEVSDPAKRFYDRLRDAVRSGETFTARDAAKRESVSKSSVSAWINELHDVGWIDQLQQSKGPSPAIWRLATRPADSRSDARLPTPQELFPR